MRRQLTRKIYGKIEGMEGRRFKKRSLSISLFVSTNNI